MFRKLVGWALIVCCTPFVIMAVSDLALGSDTSVGVLLALLFMFGLGSTAGARLVFLPRRSAAAPKALPGVSDDEKEALVLRAVRHLGGTVGAGQLAAHMGLPFAEAKARLQQLTREGACTVIVDEGGTELFRFPDLSLAPGDAARAKDLLSS